MMLLTTSEVSSVTGYDPQFVRELARTRALVPAVRGSKGKGSPNRYTVPQVVALAYARAYQDVYPGAHDLFCYVVDHVAGMSMEELFARVKDRKTLLLPMPAVPGFPPLGRFVELPPKGSVPDLVRLRLDLGDTLAAVVFNLEQVIKERFRLREVAKLAAGVAEVTA
jgi:hypothetical protein